MPTGCPTYCSDEGTAMVATRVAARSASESVVAALLCWHVPGYADDIRIDSIALSDGRIAMRYP